MCNEGNDDPPETDGLPDAIEWLLDGHDRVGYRAPDASVDRTIELHVRLARLEEKQDAQIEKLDYIANQLDEKVVTLSQNISTMRNQHDRMWIVYKWGKWLLGGMIAGGVTLEITGWL